MLLLLLVHQVLSCTKTVSFTECSSNYRAVILTPVNCSDSSQVIYSSLPCEMTCPPGHRLDFDESSQSLKCLMCPEGTYSIGGGEEHLNWINFSEDFHVYCWVLGMVGWELNTDCTTWHANSDSVLVTGTSSSRTWYETDIVFFPFMVKDGMVEISYRKESANVQGYEVGDFYVFVDENLNYFDYSSDRVDWRIVRIPLGNGKHKVQIVYDKFVTDKISDAFIRSIVVKGSKFANIECTPCRGGHSQKGSEFCTFCDIGTYFDPEKNKCQDCAPGQSSLPGSINIKSCFNLPTCQDSDWHYYFSDCEGGRQKKVYEWNSPLLCTLQDQKLPDPVNLECIPCGAGLFYDSSKCKHCPTGTYSILGSFGESCLTCPAGKYAPKAASFYTWTSFPQEFKGFCLTSDKFYCNYDWETRGTFLTTSSIYTKNSQVVLQGDFEITEMNPTVEFLFQVQGQLTKFTFYVNHLPVLTTVGDIQQSSKFELKVGVNHLKWVCFLVDEKEESCKIFTIIVNGTATGGADRCLECPLGFVSKGPNDKCEKCPNGMTSNENHTVCVECGSGMYSDVNGRCQMCPESFQSSDYGTHCELNNGTLKMQGSTFPLVNLTGTRTTQPVYCSQSKLQMFCYESFFGPIKGANHYFYLSVFNPSSSDMPSYSQISKDDAYSFGIINTSSIPVEGSSNSKPDSDCSTNNSVVVVNLGRNLESVKVDKDFVGFNLTYSNGDFCSNNSRFSTFIQFVCSKEDEEGWPIFIGYENCRFSFIWPTVHGCPLCEDADKTKERKSVRHNETCVDGQMISHYFEGEKCIFSHRKSHFEVKGQCDLHRVYKTWPFILSMILCTLMFLVVLLLVVLAFHKRRGYQRLVQVRLGGNIELSQSK